MPAIAISTDPVCRQATPDCDARNDAHFEQVADFLVQVIEQLRAKPGFLRSEPALLPAGVGLNINYPPLANPKGVAVVQQGRTAASGGTPITLRFGCYGSCPQLAVGTALPGGIQQPVPDPTPEIRSADTTAFAEGFVTIVPIAADYTAEPASRFNSVFGRLAP